MGAVAQEGGTREPEQNQGPSLAESKRNFFIFMNDLQNAGLPVLRSLNVLAEMEGNAEFKGILRAMAEHIEDGYTLSESMKEQKDVFTPLMIAMVTAGECGGVLDIVFTKAVELQEKLDKLHNQMDLNTNSRPLVHPETREFSIVLGTTIAVGVPILEALRLSKEGRSADFQAAVDDVHNAIREGDCFVTPLKRHPQFFDAVTLQMIDVGEETGELDKLLLRIGDRK